MFLIQKGWDSRLSQVSPISLEMKCGTWYVSVILTMQVTQTLVGVFLDMFYTSIRYPFHGALKLREASCFLSRTEAEWVALSEAVKEIVFVKQLLKSMGSMLSYPLLFVLTTLGQSGCPRISTHQVRPSMLTFAQNMSTNIMRMAMSKSFLSSQVKMILIS